MAELVLTSLVTIGAAFAGAWAAFKLQRVHEAGKVRTAQIEECNRALLLLMQQSNFVMNFRQQILDPYRDGAARHLLMPLTGQLAYSHLSVNAAALAFLLQTEALDLPVLIGHANDRFLRLIAAINDRSLIHKEFQIAIEASKVDMKLGAPVEDIEHAVGLRLAMTLKQSTQAVYDLAEQAQASLEAIGRDVPNVLRQVFKGEKIVAFTPG